MRCAVITAAAMLFACQWAAATLADEAAWKGPPNAAPQVDTRAGGVLSESYGYHRQQPVAGPTAAAPTWYGYGFPVQTYRWGWFGASHYYPTVLWHHGYNGDECRWAYRCGY